MKTICLLGCGLMGTPMAKRLLNAGYRLTVWNRTPAKAQALEAHGAHVAQTPAEAAQDAHIIITMLEHGSAVEQVVFAPQGAIEGMFKGCMLIDMSSVLPEQARSHATRLERLGINYLDAPVSGGTVGAEAGTLAIMVGGEDSTFASAAAVLSCLGRATHVGPVGTGQLSKLANQMIVGITIGAVAEALLMAERGGAKPDKVREALRGGFADSRILDVHGQRMIDQDFAKRGSLGIQLKDLNNALTTAENLKFKAHITDTLRSLYQQASEKGWSDLDQSALYLLLQDQQFSS